MLEELVEWLKQLTVFMLLCETLLSFAPTQTYKRYMKPFVGMILLFRIAVFLFGAVEIDWNERVEELFAHYEKSINCYLQDQAIVEESFEKEMLNEDIINIERVSIEKIKAGEAE